MGLELWLCTQVVRALFPYAKVVGLIPGQGTYKDQPMNASMNGTTKIEVSLFLCLSP